MNIMNVLNYCDGNNDVIDIGNILNLQIEEVSSIIKILKENNLIY